MTVIGSMCTRSLTHRTLICDAILYHFQITLYCGVNNRPIIPLALFLLSRPLEQLEFIRSSNSSAETSFVHPMTRPQGSILPRDFQRRYRRHLFNSKLPSQLTLTRRSLNQSSRLRIHFKQKLHVSSVQFRQNVLETNIVVIDNRIPQISLARASRRHVLAFTRICSRARGGFVVSLERSRRRKQQREEVKK